MKDMKVKDIDNIREDLKIYQECMRSIQEWSHEDSNYFVSFFYDCFGVNFQNCPYLLQWSCQR